MSVVLTLPTREELVVDLEAATTVGDLAREVEAQFGVSAFELSFNDEVLRDGKVALGDLGVADGDVLQVVIDKATEAKIVLAEMGLPLKSVHTVTRDILREDNVAAVRAYDAAGLDHVFDIGIRALCSYNAHEILEYLLTCDKFIKQQDLASCVGVKNLPLLRRLRDLGVRGMPGSYWYVRSVYNSDAAGEYFEFLMETYNGESKLAKLHSIVSKCADCETLHHATAAKIIELLKASTQVHSTAYLTAVMYNRFDWVDAMLQNCVDATHIKLHKYFGPITQHQVRYICKLLEVGTPRGASTSIFTTRLLQSVLEPHTRDLAERLLPECAYYEGIAKHLKTAEALHVLLTAVPTTERSAIICTAAKRMCTSPLEILAMQRDGLLHELGPANLRNILHQAAKASEVETGKHLLASAKEEGWLHGIPTEALQDDPLSTAISHGRSACVKIIINSVPQYSSWVYANGLTPLEFVIKAKPHKQEVAMFSILMKHCSDVSLQTLVTRAVQYVNVSVLKALIEVHNAPVDFRLSAAYGSVTLLQHCLEVGSAWDKRRALLDVVAEHAKGSCATPDSSGKLPWETASLGLQRTLRKKASQHAEHAL